MQTYCINNHNVNIFILLQDEKKHKISLPPDERERQKWLG
jgi:hypothetical protein